MKKPQPAAPAAPAPNLPAISTTELVERLSIGDRAELLSDAMREAIEHYFRSYDDYQAAHDKLGYRERDKHLFHGAGEYAHPMHRQRWLGPFNVHEQLERSLKAKDWPDVMMCAGMLCVRERIYGRPPAPKPALAPNANAVRKTAKSRPAAKKPDLPRRSRGATPGGKARKVSSPPAPKKPLATLEQIVAQAKPLFKANPNLNREQLIAKIGRRYERLTTFAELKVLCAGKTPTQHSLKQAVRKERAAVKDTTLEMAKAVSAPQTAMAWPFPMKSVPGALDAPPKRKRARRDPLPNSRNRREYAGDPTGPWRFSHAEDLASVASSLVRLRPTARAEGFRGSIFPVTRNQIAGELHRVGEHHRAAEALIELGAIPAAVRPAHPHGHVSIGQTDRTAEGRLFARYGHTERAYSTTDRIAAQYKR